MKICPEAVTRVERFLVTDREETRAIYLDFMPLLLFRKVCLSGG
jgi:hypothetical protein